MHQPLLSPFYPLPDLALVGIAKISPNPRSTNPAIHKQNHATDFFGFFLLVGALFTRLAPTAIAIGAYFCLADVILLGQVLYYNTLNARKARAAAAAPVVDDAEPDEDSPLLSRRRRSSSVGLPGSQRHHSTHSESATEPLRKMVAGEDETNDSNPWLHNSLSILAVYVIGFAGWFVSYKAGAWDGDAPGVPDTPEDVVNPYEIAGLILGYISAVLYLLARLPQIYKNWREQSCEGK